MYRIKSQSKDIYTNLATEEFLLKKKKEDILMLWSANASVVVGKHQNAIAEVNSVFLEEHSIPVARRLSGGGTVFHGPGNLNFTFIRNGEAGKLVDFHRFVKPIVDFLKTIGVEAVIGKRNDLLIGQLKISGNAEHVFRNRVLHHGTLLFNADLQMLNDSIKVEEGKYRGKAVQSNRADVTNISAFLDPPMSMDVFSEKLFSFLAEVFPESEEYQISERDYAEIKMLRDEKYCTDAWIYAYSPPFEVGGSFYYKGNSLSAYCTVNKSIITELSIKGDEQELYKIQNLVSGKTFNYNEIRSILTVERVPNELISKFLSVLF